LDQYQGAFVQALDALSAAYRQGEAAEAGRLLDGLHKQVNLGRHLTTPWRVVVAGAPNVGKSSLVNALSGFQRCVVAPTPGTTRDVVTTIIAVDGWPIELTDTAGLRAEAESLEEQGIDRARAAAAEADLCLWVLDASEPPAWPEKSADDSPLLHLILNKVDLPPAWNLKQARNALQVSARTGAGLEELCAKLADWLVPVAPPAGTAVPFTSQLSDQIVEASSHHLAGRYKEAQQLLERARRAP
jgi:tRNA modification GTPase